MRSKIDGLKQKAYKKRRNLQILTGVLAIGTVSGAVVASGAIVSSAVGSGLAGSATVAGRQLAPRLILTAKTAFDFAVAALAAKMRGDI